MSAAEQLLAENNVKIAELIKEAQRWRDASAGLNAVYPTVTEGRQSVADGKYFSVPGNGAYMRLYRRQGSSAELIAEFPDVATLNSIISQLGPLLGRGVIGSGGDLMALGAFGLGREGYLLSDFDVPPDRNEFYIGAGINATGAPSGSAYWPGIDFYRSSSDRSARLMFGPDSLSVRGWTGDNVVSDFSVYNNKNILGTASHEGGIPTGAIIERGVSSNGTYIKFADGTLIAYGIQSLEADVSQPSGPLYTTTNLLIPIAIDGTWSFFDVKKVSSAGSLIGVVSTTVFTVTSQPAISFRPMATSNLGLVTIPFAYLAMGRWY
ncbi:hypothetical protein [Vreelandella venusta]|uniref:Uncharacterized protein n=1 Tax=Vreelandella venusta TaxID=44935 RepID=A0ABX2BDM0_9GAMM|nr:hypothetical protein [Halomonas venusta]AZM95895.1 hypothetical protein EI420_09435 [Halomonas venusta]NPT30826.1 hypothetical protein [Halomonas venusta]